MLNSLGQPLHNPAEGPIIRGTQRKKPKEVGNNSSADREARFGDE
jgi:hypothetical protein